MYNSFHSLFQSKVVWEKKRVNRRKPIQPWMTYEILGKKRKMDINRKKFLKKPNENNEIQYKRSKKEYNNDIKKAKNKYYGDELFRAQKDSKKLWSIINSLIQNRTKSEPIKSIKFEDKILTDNKEIAEVFSNYYKYAAIKKVNAIKSEINFEHFLNDKDKRVNTFHLKEIDSNDLLDVIKNIKPKSSSGFDSIPNKLVCKAAPSLIAPLKFIINKSFSNGKFPDLLKT